MNLYDIFKQCGSRVTTDSRKISGGELFFALKGENFDGNAYAASALEAGAAYAVVDDQSLPDNPRFVKVADSLAALHELAAEHRENVLGPGKRLQVIGLTGTNGKTTTKELIREVLSVKYRVVATEGNLNNDIGVPLTVLRFTPETQIAVVEMGANHPDDIGRLVKVCHPDYGLITNVGKAHLLGFGSFEGVKAAKGQLYDWLASHGGVIFLNEDDADLREMALGRACHSFGYGFSRQNASLLPTDAENPYMGLKMPSGSYRTHLVGSYNATNALAAVAIGQYFGIDESAALEAISAYEPSNKRSQLTRTSRNTVVLDAYNANPSSMRAALDNFAAMQTPGKIAILGDMRELGDNSAAEHRAILERASSLGLKVLLAGLEFTAAAQALDNPAFILGCFDTSEALAQHIASQPISGRLLLLKGSRGMTMEKVLEYI